MKKVNFDQLNVKPFISSKNRYQSDLFVDKFKKATNKLLALKNINAVLKPHESLVVQSKSISSIPTSWPIIPFSYGDHRDIGYVVLSSPCALLFIQKLMGGDDGLDLSATERELSKLETRTLESLNSIWKLSLREALTPFLYLHDVEISSFTTFLNLNLKDDSYFYEIFNINDHDSLEIHVFFKTKPLELPHNVG